VGFTFANDVTLQYEAPTSMWASSRIGFGFSTKSRNSRVLRGERFGKQRGSISVDINESGHIVVTVETEHSVMVRSPNRHAEKYN